MSSKASEAYAAGLARNHAFDAVALPQEEKKSILQNFTLRWAFFVSLWTIIQLIIIVTKTVKGSAAGDAFHGYNSGCEAIIMTSISLTFLLMSPTLMAMLHSTFLRRYICFDKANKAHKFVAYTLVFWTLQHVITHYYKFHQIAASSNGKMSIYYMLYVKSTGKIGHAILGLLIVLLVGALPAVRRKCFELFYLLHHLSFVIVILIFFHIDKHTFQYYITGPGIIYLTDRIFRAVRARFNRPRILSIIQHPSNVIEIRFERNGMKYKAGQFIYLCVPSLSWYQWHPFTLTSAPEEGELSVHISINGGWTRSLVYALQQHAAAAPRRMNIEHHSRRSPNKRTDSVDSNRTLTPSYDIRNQNTGGTQGPTHPPGARVAGGGRNNNDGGRQMDLHRQASKRSANNVRMGSVERNGRYPPEMDYYMSVNRPYTHAQMRANKALPAAPSQATLPTIMVDGPYNAPTQDVFEYDHIVLIAGNIGITPMSSVLKSLYYQLTTTGGKARFKRYILFGRVVMYSRSNGFRGSCLR